MDSSPKCSFWSVIVPITPESRPEGFIAEARGTCQTTDTVVVSQNVIGGLGPPSTQPLQASSASGTTKSKNPLFELQTYDGSACLETFLLQFKYLTTYLQWEEKDRFYHMCVSLDGPAGHVLWELPTNATTADLECLLQARFGTQLQAESFKAKLRTRRRAVGETLQDLYRDESFHSASRSWQG